MREDESSPAEDSLSDEVRTIAEEESEASLERSEHVEELHELLATKLSQQSTTVPAIILVVVVTFALRAGQLVLIPLVLAVMLSFLLDPVVTALTKLRIHRVIGAALALLMVLGAIGAGLYFLADPIGKWSNELPQTLRQVERRIRPIEKSLEEIAEAGDRLDKIRSLGQDSKPQQVMTTEKEGMVDLLMGQAKVVLVGAGVVLPLMYFLLLSADRFLEKLVSLQPRLRDAIRSVRIVRKIKKEISNYLFTISWINLLLGVAVAVAMYFLEMPSPILWGVMAALLNFIPYIGAVVGIFVVTMVAVATFQDLGDIAVVPVAYFALTALEANLFTPAVLGRRLTLSPVVIFIGLIFWTWLWGIPGAILSVPLLVTIKIICDSVDPLQPIGLLLGR